MGWFVFFNYLDLINQHFLSHLVYQCLCKLLWHVIVIVNDFSTAVTGRRKSIVNLKYEKSLHNRNNVALLLQLCKLLVIVTVQCCTCSLSRICFFFFSSSVKFRFVTNAKSKLLNFSAHYKFSFFFPEFHNNFRRHWSVMFTFFFMSCVVCCLTWAWYTINLNSFLFLKFKRFICLEMVVGGFDIFFFFVQMILVILMTSLTT